MATASGPIPEWDGPEYSRVPDGTYQAVAVRFQGPEWVYTYRRWSLLVEFELLDSSARVCAFYSLQDNPAKPRVARRGKYFRDWTRANRDLPRKGQPMTPDVFLEGQVYSIEVSENRKTENEGEKNEGEIYSTVTRIVNIQFPATNV